MIKLTIRFALHGKTVEREALLDSLTSALRWGQLLAGDGCAVTISR